MTNIERVLVYKNMPEPLKVACLDNGMTDLCVPFASVLIAAKAVKGRKGDFPTTENFMESSKPLIKELLKVKGLNPNLQDDVEKAAWDYIDYTGRNFDEEIYPYAIFYTIANPLPRFN